VNPENIVVTGNTVIDALLQVKQKVEQDQALVIQFQQEFSFLDADKKLILVTGHRRENFGQGFLNICTALANWLKNIRYSNCLSCAFKSECTTTC
jgi:UDP-N-acetylglucosamine 2-epimerase (non-hydrolysing)